MRALASSIAAACVVANVAIAPAALAKAVVDELYASSSSNAPPDFVVDLAGAAPLSGDATRSLTAEEISEIAASLAAEDLYAAQKAKQTKRVAKQTNPAQKAKKTAAASSSSAAAAAKKKPAAKKTEFTLKADSDASAAYAKAVSGGDATKKKAKKATPAAKKPAPAPAAKKPAPAPAAKKPAPAPAPRARG